jgi:nitroimidazol reductase NimA-like FMN-containing flavoprotein (pyridoxamine 5'-phosphate oxidase superfamily)
MDSKSRPQAIDIDGQLENLSHDECMKLLTSTPIGRLGFVVDDELLVLPFNYAWFDGKIVFRTIEGQKMAAVAQGWAVCFEVDDWDANEQTGWSVVIKGTAREVTGWAEKEALEQIGLVPWSHGEWRPLWVEVEPTEITGRVIR